MSVHASGPRAQHRMRQPFNMSCVCCRAWTEEERQKQTSALQQLIKRSTAKQYQPYINNYKVMAGVVTQWKNELSTTAWDPGVINVSLAMLQEWCAAHGTPDDLSSVEDAPKAGRFLEQWCSGSWVSPGNSPRVLTVPQQATRWGQAVSCMHVLA